MGWQRQQEDGREGRLRAPAPWEQGRPPAVLWPGLRPPLRYLAGFALLGFCLWMPAFIGLFVR